MKVRDKITIEILLYENHPAKSANAQGAYASWRNHATSTSRTAQVSEQSAQTCVEDRASNMF